jgi:hypothetical protein
MIRVLKALGTMPGVLVLFMGFSYLIGTDILTYLGMPDSGIDRRGFVGRQTWHRAEPRGVARRRRDQVCWVSTLL